MNTILDKLDALIAKASNVDEPAVKAIEEIVMKTVNLCDTCTKEVPTCNGKVIQWGNGFGKDNIVRCQTYKLKI